MANPLLNASASGGGELPPGGIRIIEVRDKSGNLIKTLTLYRTNRDYAYDLADAYNAGMDPAARQRGAQWQVGHNGELKLGYCDESIRENRRQSMSRLETERSRYIRHQLEHQPHP
jgi:hypothetical protein